MNDLWCNWPPVGVRFVIRTHYKLAINFNITNLDRLLPVSTSNKGIYFNKTEFALLSWLCKWKFKIFFGFPWLSINKYQEKKIFLKNSLIFELLKDLYPMTTWKLSGNTNNLYSNNNKIPITSASGKICCHYAAKKIKWVSFINLSYLKTNRMYICCQNKQPEAIMFLKTNLYQYFSKKIFFNLWKGKI